MPPKEQILATLRASPVKPADVERFVVAVQASESTFKQITQMTRSTQDSHSREYTL